MSKKFMAATALVALTAIGTGATLVNSEIASAQPRVQKKFSPRAVPDTGLLYAVVSSNSTSTRLVRGNGALRASIFQDGNYLVTFNRDVTACSAVAGLGSASGGSIRRGFITATPKNTTVSVVTRDSTGLLVNSDFHLQLMCD